MFLIAWAIDPDQQRPQPLFHLLFSATGIVSLLIHIHVQQPAFVSACLTLLATPCQSSTNHDHVRLALDPIHMSASMAVSTQLTQPTILLNPDRVNSAHLTQFGSTHLTLLSSFQPVFSCFFTNFGNSRYPTKV